MPLVQEDEPSAGGVFLEERRWWQPSHGDHRAARGGFREPWAGGGSSGSFSSHIDKNTNHISPNISAFYCCYCCPLKSLWPRLSKISSLLSLRLPNNPPAAFYFLLINDDPFYVRSVVLLVPCLSMLLLDPKHPDFEC